jgi:hypothetical protein
MQPQVGQITKIKTIILPNGRTGDMYLLPGFEAIPVVACKPCGSLAKSNKLGWTIYELSTGLLIYSYPYSRVSEHTAIDALKIVHTMFIHRGMDAILQTIKKHFEK